MISSQHNMATSRSKTLSKTDLLSWRNEAIVRAFERNITTSDIAHIFDVTQRQVQRLQARWYKDGDIAPVRRPGRPRSAQRTRARRTMAEKVARDPLRTVADLSRESGISRTTGGRVMKELGLRSRAREGRQKLTARDKNKRQFFRWLGGDIGDNSLLVMDGAPARTANVTQAAKSRLIGEVGGALSGKQD